MKFTVESIPSAWPENGSTLKYYTRAHNDTN